MKIIFLRLYFIFGANSTNTSEHLLPYEESEWAFFPLRISFQKLTLNCMSFRRKDSKGGVCTTFSIKEIKFINEKQKTKKRKKRKERTENQ